MTTIHVCVTQPSQRRRENGHQHDKEGKRWNRLKGQTNNQIVSVHKTETRGAVFLKSSTLGLKTRRCIQPRLFHRSTMNLSTAEHVYTDCDETRPPWHRWSEQETSLTSHTRHTSRYKRILPITSQKAQERRSVNPLTDRYTLSPWPTSKGEHVED